MRIRAIILMGLLAMALLLAASAQASADRVTQGEAQAFFRSGTGDSPALISPFIDGRHYCVLDWHVVALASLAGGDQSFTRQDAVAILGPEEMTFVLNGFLVETKRTAIARYLGDLSNFPDVTVAYYYREGLVLSPSDLEVGSHTLSVELTDSSGAVFVYTASFHIDAAGEGACL
jgi:hypothetical protein